jgi:hypothetical protein
MNQMFTLKLFTKTSFTKWMILFLVTMIVAAPVSVHAARMLCRSDPIVFLSDGTRLQFNAAIGTARENVRSIRYELHAPAGVSIDRIVFTPNWAREIETVQLINDQAPGNYVIVAVVDTGAESASVEISAMAVARNSNGAGSTHQTATGVSGQTIVVHFAAQ